MGLMGVGSYRGPRAVTGVESPISTAQDHKGGFFTRFNDWREDHKGGLRVASKMLLAMGQGFAETPAGSAPSVYWGRALNQAGQAIDPALEREKDLAGDEAFEEWIDERLVGLDPESDEYRVLSAAKGRGRQSDRFAKLLPSLMAAEDRDARRLAAGSPTAKAINRDQQTIAARQALIRNKNLINRGLLEGKNNIWTHATRRLETMEDPEFQKFYAWASRGMSELGDFNIGYDEFGITGADERGRPQWGRIEPKPTGTAQDDPPAEAGEEKSGVVAAVTGALGSATDAVSDYVGDAYSKVFGDDEEDIEIAGDQTPEAVLGALVAGSDPQDTGRLDITPSNVPIAPTTTAGLGKTGSPGLLSGESPGTTNISRLERRRQFLENRRRQDESGFDAAVGLDFAKTLIEKTPEFIDWFSRNKDERVADIVTGEQGGLYSRR